jgi:hypothetical protein
MHDEGVESVFWRTYFKAQATDERVLLTSQEHAFARVVAALGRLCAGVETVEAGRSAHGDWPKQRPTHRIEARLRELAPGSVRVTVFAHPIRLGLFPAERCRRCVRQFVRTLIYDD